jgi:hypothetical protein
MFLSMVEGKLGIEKGEWLWGKLMSLMSDNNEGGGMVRTRGDC